DLTVIEPERPGVLDHVDAPDHLHVLAVPRPGADRDGLRVDTELLTELAARRVVPGLPRTDDATCRDVPPARPHVLVRRPLVHEQATFVHDQQVHRAVTETMRTHLSARDDP